MDRKCVATGSREMPDAKLGGCGVSSSACLALTAAEPALVRLAVSKGEDIRFSQLTLKNGLSPARSATSFRTIKVSCGSTPRDS